MPCFHLNIPNIMITIFIKFNCSNPMSAFCGYEEINNPISSRKYLSISNINDPTIPYLGGNSKVGLIFKCGRCIFILQKIRDLLVKNYHLKGQLWNPIIFEYSYLSGDVVHIKGNASTQ